MSTQTEQNCLSVLMKSADDVYRALDMGLEKRHFQDASHSTLFDAICRAAAAVKDTSAHSVYIQISDMKGQSPFDFSLITQIDNLVPTSANLKPLVAAVIGETKRRDLRANLRAACEITEAGEAATFDELLEQVSPHIEAAQNVTSVQARRTISDIANSLAYAVEHPENRKIIATPWSRWDTKATPLKAGEMITIAARPGLGKTALAINLGEHAARHEEKTLIFSLEMSGEELLDRLARKRGGHITYSRQDKYLDAIHGCGKLSNLHIYDNSERHTISTIEARCRLHAGIGEGVGLVIIDYLQLIDPTDRRMPREQQVAEISRRIKQLAGILHCPVIVLAQLNRAIEKEDRKPLLSDLRESGAIEQDSDRVWFLWQDPKTIQPGVEEPPDIPMLLLQMKCRGGPPNVATNMLFDRPIFTFKQITPR